jgi:hypothetical protein
LQWKKLTCYEEKSRVLVRKKAQSMGSCAITKVATTIRISFRKEERIDSGRGIKMKESKETEIQ